MERRPVGGVKASAGTGTGPGEELRAVMRSGGVRAARSLWAMATSMRRMKGEIATMSDRAEFAARDIELDVREDLRQGREPFTKIMEAVGRVPPGGSLTLYATFKPVPLIAILRRHGFEAQPEKIEGGDWMVVFRRTGEEAGAAIAQGPADQAGGGPGGARAGEAASGVVELDNRGLEPPMPMVNTLEAINRLKPGERIVGYYDRRPMFLIPKLDQMGLAYEVSDLESGGVRLVISRKV